MILNPIFYIKSTPVGVFKCWTLKRNQTRQQPTPAVKARQLKKQETKHHYEMPEECKETEKRGKAVRCSLLNVYEGMFTLKAGCRYILKTMHIC